MILYTYTHRYVYLYVCIEPFSEARGLTLTHVLYTNINVKIYIKALLYGHRRRFSVDRFTRRARHRIARARHKHRGIVGVIIRKQPTTQKGYHPLAPTRVGLSWRLIFRNPGHFYGNDSSCPHLHLTRRQSTKIFAKNRQKRKYKWRISKRKFHHTLPPPTYFLFNACRIKRINLFRTYIWAFLKDFVCLHSARS